MELTPSFLQDPWGLGIPHGWTPLESPFGYKAGPVHAMGNATWAESTKGALVPMGCIP